ncbi:MAG: hypothetical protein JST66_01390 [Bacteroidetes bacterium]|nr:hypothetical protein [Bacteroidota bacterium]
MRRALFLLTLGLYAWSALELHEWVRLPEVVIHFVEHHSDFGHHDDAAHTGQSEEHQHGHEPMSKDCRDHFCACNVPALIATRPQLIVTDLRGPLMTLEAFQESGDIASFSGSKWNPPRA